MNDSQPTGSSSNSDADDLSSLPPVVVGPLELNREPAEESPRPVVMSYRKRPLRMQDEDGSRELMLGWCLWLLASWMMLGGGFRGTPTRQMVFASCIGMLIVWPAYRLSQSGKLSPWLRHRQADNRPYISHLTPGVIFRDWFALNGVFQAVLWPHVITRHWAFEQAAWVSGAVAAWSLLIGAVVAGGCRLMSGLGRSMMMLLVLAILFLEPVMVLAIRTLLPHVKFQWTMHITPIQALHELTAPPAQFYAQAWGFPIIFVLLAAVLGWVGVIRMTRRNRAAA